MRRWLVLGCLLGCLWGNGLLHAATGVPAESGFRFGMNLGHHQAKEEALVPYAWRGPDFGLEPSYATPLMGRTWTFGGRLSLSYLQNVYDHQAAIIGWWTGVDITPLHRVNFQNHQIDLGMRYRFGNEGLYLFDWDDAHLYGFAGHELGVLAATQFRLTNDRSTLVQLSIPLLSFYTRPTDFQVRKQDRMTQSTGWMGRAFEQLEFHLPGSFFALDWEVHLIKTSSDSPARWTFFYRGSYRYADWPKPMQILKHELVLTRRFGK